jgi:arginyl-tRNA synthetase
VVTIDDIVDAIGVDAARYALARYSLDSPIDLDLDLWTRRSNENPVYYVQYAHARIASLLRAAAESGITRGSGYDPGLLSHVRETDLFKALAEFPSVVAEVPRAFRTGRPIGWAVWKGEIVAPTEEELLTGIQG